MSFAPIQIVIDGVNKSFNCPLGWTVGELEIRIRNRYSLSGGGIDCDGLPTKATDVIVGGHSYAFTEYQKG